MHISTDNNDEEEERQTQTPLLPQGSKPLSVVVFASIFPVGELK
jgi:hypothetical protein